MTKKVSVHCTASNRAFKLFVRSVVKSVQAYCRLAIASIATEQATSISQRERSELLSRGEVIDVRYLTWPLLPAISRMHKLLLWKAATNPTYPPTRLLRRRWPRSRLDAHFRRPAASRFCGVLLSQRRRVFARSKCRARSRVWTPPTLPLA